MDVVNVVNFFSLGVMWGIGLSVWHGVTESLQFLFFRTYARSSNFHIF